MSHRFQTDEGLRVGKPCDGGGGDVDRPRQKQSVFRRLAVSVGTYAEALSFSHSRRGVTRGAHY